MDNDILYDQSSGALETWAQMPFRLTFLRSFSAASSSGLMPLSNLLNNLGFFFLARGILKRNNKDLPQEFSIDHGEISLEETYDPIMIKQNKQINKFK